jgi:UDP-glucose 4-epimerase
VNASSCSTTFPPAHRWAVAEGAQLAIGETGDQALVTRLIREHDVETIIHFAASIVVPDSVRDPLGYYRNNTVNSRALIETAIGCSVRHFIFSSTAAVYGNPATVPVTEDAPTLPMSPYGWSKLMTEIMLRDTSYAHGMGHVILRYFNVAGADPRGRTGQSTAAATHLIKVAAETALGLPRTKDGFYLGARRRRCGLRKRQDSGRGPPCSGVALTLCESSGSNWSECPRTG